MTRGGTALKRTRSGRLAALVGVRGDRARGMSAARARPPPRPPPRHRPPPVGRGAVGAAPRAASPALPRGGTVGYLPKDIVNQYFDAAKTGADKAAGELGGTVTQVGPNEAKADLQIPFITDLTTQGVNAIIISADGPDEVAPALKAAMDGGHQGRRLRLQPGRRRLRRVRQPGGLQPRRHEPRRLGLRARSRTAPATSRSSRRPRRPPNQNTWIDGMKTTLPATRSTRASSSSTPSTAMTTRTKSTHAGPGAC